MDRRPQAPQTTRDKKKRILNIMLEKQIIPVQESSSASMLPRAINVVEQLNAREFEIKAMESALANARYVYYSVH